MTDEAAEEKKFGQLLKEWGRSDEDIIRGLRREALAELADPAFKVRKPEPRFVRGSMDDPAGPEARQQVKDLEEALKHSHQIAALKDAEQILNRWLEREQRNGRQVPRLDPSIRTAIARMIACGEYVADAVSMGLARAKSEVKP